MFLQIVLHMDECKKKKEKEKRRHFVKLSIVTSVNFKIAPTFYLHKK